MVCNASYSNRRRFHLGPCQSTAVDQTASNRCSICRRISFWNATKMKGFVDQAGRAISDIAIVSDRNETPSSLNACIDMEFTGKLVLPCAIVEDLKLVTSMRKTDCFDERLHLPSRGSSATVRKRSIRDFGAMLCSLLALPYSSPRRFESRLSIS